MSDEQNTKYMGPVPMPTYPDLDKLHHDQTMSLLKARLDAAWRGIAADFKLYTGQDCPKMRDVLIHDRASKVFKRSKDEKPVV